MTGSSVTISDNDSKTSDTPAAQPMQYKYRPKRPIRQSQNPKHSLGTNDIFSLVHCPFTSGEARRWRDLLVFYYEKLGPAFFDENIRIKILAIVNLTLELERQTEACVTGSSPGRLIRSSGPPHRRVLEYRSGGDPESMITLINTIVSLQKQIGIE